MQFSHISETSGAHAYGWCSPYLRCKGLLDLYLTDIGRVKHRINSSNSYFFSNGHGNTVLMASVKISWHRATQIPMLLFFVSSQDSIDNSNLPSQYSTALVVKHINYESRTYMKQWYMCHHINKICSLFFAQQSPKDQISNRKSCNNNEKIVFFLTIYPYPIEHCPKKNTRDWCRVLPGHQTWVRHICSLLCRWNFPNKKDGWYKKKLKHNQVFLAL